MAQSSNPLYHQRSPRSSERSPELLELLAHCPEHLFSTDDDQLAPIERDAHEEAEAPGLERAA